MLPEPEFEPPYGLPEVVQECGRVFDKENILLVKYIITYDILHVCTYLCMFALLTVLGNARSEDMTAQSGARLAVLMQNLGVHVSTQGEPIRAIGSKDGHSIAFAVAIAKTWGGEGCISILYRVLPTTLMSTWA